jgi:hypothetical protein
MDDLDLVLNEIRDMLLHKNDSYGNSALNPIRIFSKADKLEGIRVRLDDKLSRMVNSPEDEEDTELDFLGYLIMLRIGKKNEKD